MGMMGLPKVSSRIYEVRAHWDAEASVWWAESNDIRGLVAESDTIEGLIEDVRELVPELLQLNGEGHDNRFTLNFSADRAEEVSFS